MPWKKIIPLMIAVSGLSASVEEIVDGKRPIEVAFSKSSHNRIAIEDGAVEKVVGDGSLFSIEIDPITGNAFVHVLEEIGETPATLSVVTSSGLVQDLLVTSREGTSEQVLLREKEERDAFNFELSFAPTVEVLNKILEGKIPFGYGQMESVEKLNLPEPLQSEELKAFEGPFETISVYVIANQGKEAIVLTADALKKGNGSWAFLNVHELGEDQKAICILGRPKDESKK